MDNLNKLYDIRLKILKFLKFLIPKFIKRKINKKFFPYYFLITDYQKLPYLNYINNNNLDKQKILIEKFDINQQQNSLIRGPLEYHLNINPTTARILQMTNNSNQ